MPAKIITANKGSNLTITEISIITERLTHLLQTITENYNGLEDGQRYSLIEIAWDISTDIDKWAKEEEEREQAH